MTRVRLQVTRRDSASQPIALQILADAVCGRGCDFCSIEDAESGARNMSLEEIVANLRYFDDRGEVGSVIFAGGEPTDRQDLLEILEVTSGLVGTTDIVVVSRGDRWRSDKAFLARVAKLPVRLIFSLDLWTAEDADPSREFSLVSRGSRAIAESIRHGIPVETNTVISRQLLGLGPLGIEALAALPCKTSTLTFPFPKGGALAFEDEIVPSIPEAAEWLNSISTAFEREGREWRLKGLPICYVPQFRSHMSRTRDRRYVSAIHQFDGAQRYFDDRIQLVHDHSCSTCTALPECDGFWSHYLDGHNFSPLSPIQ